MFPRETITLLYTREFSAGYFVLAILAFGVFSNVFTGMTGSILIASGKPRLNLYCEIIAALTNVSLNLLLIPRYGILGAAIGTSISFLMRNIASLIFVYTTNKIHPYTKKYLGIIVSGLLVFIGFYLFKSQVSLTLPLWAYVILMGLILMVVYLLFIVMLRCLDKNDIFIIKLLTNRLGIKSRLFDRF